MNHNLRTRNALHEYTSRYPRRLTTAGRFWACYVVGVLVCLYAVVDLIERVLR